MKYLRFYDYANTDSWWSRLEDLCKDGWRLHSIVVIEPTTSRIMVIMEKEEQ